MKVTRHCANSFRCLGLVYAALSIAMLLPAAIDGILS